MSTVSRVINGREDVSDRTRKSVLGAIEELGYAPRETARRLVGRRANTLSLLFPQSHAILSSFGLEFVMGAAQATGERGYSFNLITEEVDERRLLGLYRSGSVDGVLLMQVKLEDWRVELLAREDVPFVMVGRTAQTRGLSYVDFDFEAAIEQTFEHLVSLGHRRIAFIGRPSMQLRAALGAAVRLEKGFERAAERLEIEPIRTNTDLNSVAMSQATQRLLEAHPDLTAIATTTGPATSGVLDALHTRGLSVPDDVSVSALCSEQVARMIYPGLSGATFPSEEIGYQAAGMLIRRLDERRRSVDVLAAEQVVLPASFTSRGSTSPPPRPRH